MMGKPACAALAFTMLVALFGLVMAIAVREMVGSGGAAGGGGGLNSVTGMNPELAAVI